MCTTHCYPFIFEAELITLDEFNGKLRSYPYLYFETKPTPLSTQAIKDYDLSGKQSGKYTLYIVRSLISNL